MWRTVVQGDHCWNKKVKWKRPAVRFFATAGLNESDQRVTEGIWYTVQDGHLSLVCVVSSFSMTTSKLSREHPRTAFFLQLGRRSPSSESSELSSKCTIVCSSLSCTQPVSWHFSPACCRGGHQDICSMMFIGLLVVLFRLKWTTIATSRSRLFFPHHSTNLHTRSLYSCSWPFLKQPTTAESSENFCRCYKSDLFLTSVVYRVKRKGNSTVSCGSLWCFGIK